MLYRDIFSNWLGGGGGGGGGEFQSQGSPPFPLCCMKAVDENVGIIFI